MTGEKYCTLYKEPCTPDAEGFGECGDGLEKCSLAHEITRIRVRVPVMREVTYLIDVPDPDDLEAIKEQLKNTDASNWEDDPCFYEHLGESFRDCVDEITEEHVEVTRYDNR